MMGENEKDLEELQGKIDRLQGQLDTLVKKAAQEDKEEQWTVFILSQDHDWYLSDKNALNGLCGVKYEDESCFGAVEMSFQTHRAPFYVEEVKVKATRKTLEDTLKRNIDMGLIIGYKIKEVED